MIRLYGHLRGSFKTVTEGLELAFRELGVLDGTFYGEATEFEQEPPGGASSPIAVVTGDPLRVLQAHYHGQHRKKFLLLAPNSMGIVRSLVRQLKEPVKLPSGEKVPTLDGFLAPSYWAQEVLKECFPDHPVIYCPHGVLPIFRKDAALREAARLSLVGNFSVLHVTSSRLSRKGTSELLEAWAMFIVIRLDVNYRLDILANPEYFEEFSACIEALGLSETVRVYPGQNMSGEDYVKLLQHYNFVIQPSRAEGFGLVPLEARACGVPAIATSNTGHADHHFGPGTIEVQASEIGASDDYLGAVAPSVKSSHILLALVRALTRAEILHSEALEQADIVAESWAWSEKVKSAVTKMQELL